MEAVRLLEDNGLLWRGVLWHQSGMAKKRKNAAAGRAEGREGPGGQDDGGGAEREGAEGGDV